MWIWVKSLPPVLPGAGQQGGTGLRPQPNLNHEASRAFLPSIGVQLPSKCKSLDRDPWSLVSPSDAAPGRLPLDTWGPAGHDQPQHSEARAGASRQAHTRAPSSDPTRCGLQRLVPGEPQTGRPPSTTRHLARPARDPGVHRSVSLEGPPVLQVAAFCVLTGPALHELSWYPSLL